MKNFALRVAVVDYSIIFSGNDCRHGQYQYHQPCRNQACFPHFFHLTTHYRQPLEHLLYGFNFHIVNVR